MNRYIIDELEDFLVAAKRNELTSVVVAATTRDGRSIASWEVHDSDIFDSLEFVQKCAEDGVVESHVLELDATPYPASNFNLGHVLESDYEENIAQGHSQTEDHQGESVELREARPEASEENGTHQN